MFSRLTICCSCVVAVAYSACATQEYCNAYACANAASFTGDVTVSAEAEALDLELCRAGTCESGSIELAEISAQRGSCAGEGRSDHPLLACATLAPDAERTYALLARWHFNGSDELGGPDAFDLRVAERPSGIQLINTTKTVVYHVTREDNCHRCWGGSQTFE